MTRIPYVRREELGPEGQQLWDGIVGSVGGQVVTADGGLAGPFNAFVTVPGAGRRLSALGAKLRFGTSIERRLSEIAIITTGVRWQAEFEWWAHAAMAREHGVAGAVVDAIGRGEDPPFEADDERAVYAAARQLASSGRLDQEAYEARRLGAGEVYDSQAVDVIDAVHAAHPDGVDAVLDLVSGPDAIRRDAEVIRPGGRLVSTIFAADEGWFAGRQITAHNHASGANPLISPEGLATVAQMLADGTITARIRSTVDLDAAGQVLDQLRRGGLRGKAVIRL